LTDCLLIARRPLGFFVKLLLVSTNRKLNGDRREQDNENSR